MSIVYLSIDDCKQRCFPYIRENLHYEHLPKYEKEPEHMKILESILFFVRQDSLYKNFQEKAAYLFCSIANGHAFTNGNKRLAATLLRYFLSDNKVKTVDVSTGQWQELLKSVFPAYAWQGAGINDPFYLFLYNLAFIAADGQLRPGTNFEVLKDVITAIFGRIFEVPQDCLPTQESV